MRKIMDIIEVIKEKDNLVKIRQYLENHGYGCDISYFGHLFPDSVKFYPTGIIGYPVIITTWNRILFKIVEEHLLQNPEDITVDDAFIQTVATEILKRIQVVHDTI